MAEKEWWETAWDITYLVIGIAVIVVSLVSSEGNSGTGSGSGHGSVWTVGGGGKKPGSWSSGRHG